MSVSILHFARHPHPFFLEVHAFAIEKGLQLRRTGQGSKNSCGAQVIVYEWQVDLLDHLPLYNLNCSHVVVPADLAAVLAKRIRDAKKCQTKVKFRKDFFWGTYVVAGTKGPISFWVICLANTEVHA